MIPPHARAPLVTHRPRDDRIIDLVLTRPLTNPFEPSPTCPTQAKCLWPATMLPRSPKTSSEIDEVVDYKNVFAGQ